MEIIINNKKYKIIKDYGDTIDESLLKEYITEFYNDYDYIVGDWAYGKLRLKGFYKNNNKKVKSYNNYDNLNDYLINNCAYGCKYFVIEQLNEIVEKE